MAPRDPYAAAHQEWLDLVQPVGLVVSPPALVVGQAILPKNVMEPWRRLRELTAQDDASYLVTDLAGFCREFLEWPANFVVRDDVTLEGLTVALPEFVDRLEPTFAVRDPESPGWLLLAQAVDADSRLDHVPADQGRTGWRATPQARFERLLRTNNVPIGLLCNGKALRLVYAPQGESSGHVTFYLHQMAEVGGRPLLAALLLLLGQDRLFALPDNQRLPHLLKESRKYQNTVTQRLAEQVLTALGGLLTGFQAADQQSAGRLLHDTSPAHIYEGLLGSILRTIFLLYAEERGMLPADEGFLRSYSVLGLYTRLREDQALHPDTMDQRYSAWPQLLALWRILHDGVRWTTSDGHTQQLPPRRGRLFDPDAWPFLEGRTRPRQVGERLQPPRVADNVVLQLLSALLLLDEERLSYRALDVEQIGSVYESMMGFVVQTATGPSLGVTPHHVVVNLEDVLAQPAGRRVAWLKEASKCELTGESANRLRDARTVDDVVAALGRKVSARTPQVIPIGGRFLQPTEERRRTGAHYTPPSLTEPIVKKTLEPLLADFGHAPTPEQILGLRLCDPAMGSGAFLVQACKQLADLLVAAWSAHSQTPDIPPDEDPLLHARRLVAQQCLYGVDKNPVAVDLAKLSIWLTTLAKDHPFTFVDHALRCGDSLVGLTQNQIAAFDWQPRKQLGFIEKLVRSRLEQSVVLRDEVRTAGDVRDTTDQHNTWRLSEDQLDDVRLLGDAVIAAFFGADKPAGREALRQRYEQYAMDWLNGGNGPGALQAVVAQMSLRPFHWEIEYPEVFGRENVGFDAFVGNPPFLGGSSISSNFGQSMRDWLLGLHAESHGNADLVAHFFRRAFCLLRPSGTFGLIATNTIGQGDTRATGLRWIATNGGEIYAAVRRLKWPGLAAVSVSLVHLRRARSYTPKTLDGHPASFISAFLFDGGSHESPTILATPAAQSFMGSKIYGQGFTFDDTGGLASSLEDMGRLLLLDSRNAQRIYPYIGGEEVNNSPTLSHNRYVINFEQLSLDEASRWPDLIKIVRDKVKPERDKLREDTGPGAHGKKWWWQFQHPRQPLYAAIGRLHRCLVNSQVSSHLAFAFQPTDRVLAHSLNVFASDSDSFFAVLQGSVHEVWARFFASSLESRLRYTPSDCFETFPFPLNWQSDPTLEAIGEQYYNFRAELMIRNNQGLTATYNRFHDPDEQDPDIARLRELHAAMDRAVLDAYGWSDIVPVCAFLLDHEDDDAEAEPGTRRRKKPWRYRWVDEVRDEVLARLLELNGQRAQEETLAAAGTLGAVAKAGKGKKAHERQGGLF